MAAQDRSGLDRRQGHSPSEQSRLRSIVERMADGVVVVDLNGVIRFANPAAARLFGRSTDYLIGAPLGSPAIAGDVAEIEVVRSGGEVVHVELRVVDTDWDGDRARLASLRDITDRKRAQEHAVQIERERGARAEAEAASQAKSDFLATMSHELRTPLNAIIGYADLLDMEIAGSLSAEQQHHISRIRASGRHLLGLVNEVLDLAKVESGQLTLRPGTGRVHETVDGARVVVHPLAESRGIQLTTRLRVLSAATYNGDEDRVRQILVNLFNNAVKFTPSGGAIVIECGETTEPKGAPRLRSGDRWTYFRVTDTGIGIAPEQIAVIFDPFVQGTAGHTRPKDGSGLGLTISRRLARMMKGDLTVASAVGVGSTFTLWLPATNVEAVSPDSLTQPDQAAASRFLGLASLGEFLVRELASIIDVFVARLRSERIAPAVESFRFSQLADHIGTYVADLGAMLIAIEESRGESTALIADGTEIQRLVAERHGAQRARLGWTEDALHREWSVLLEEVERAIRRPGRHLSDDAEVEGQAIIRRFMKHGEDRSCQTLTRVLRDGLPPGDRSG